MTTTESRSIDVPAALLARATKFGPATGPERSAELNQWVQGHNEIVMRFFHNGLSDDTMTRNERAILALASGLRNYVAMGDFSAESPDYLANRDVVRPLVRAFIAALNWDLGRLDGGTLDHWARRLYTDVTGDESDDL